MDKNAIICGRLTLERCQNYVNHIHAVLFMCGQDDDQLDATATNHIRRITSLLGQELKSELETDVMPNI